MVTLDIEDTNIRVMEIQGKKVKTAVSVPLAQGLVKDGVVLIQEAVGRLIKDIFNIQGIREQKVSLSVSGINSMYRVSTVPRLPSNIITEAARREMEKAIPVPLEELYTSWQATSPSSTETMFSMVGLRHETVDSMLGAIHFAGLTCGVMDLKPLAVARVIDEKNAMVINTQPGNYDVVVVSNGIPELVRSISFTKMDMPLDAKITELIEELGRTVTFYNSSQHPINISKNTPLFLSGVFKDQLIGKLDFTIKPVPEVFIYPEGLQSEEYIVNIGMALKQSKSNGSPFKVNMNVLPAEYLPKRTPISHIISWLFVLLALIIIIVLIFNAQQALSKTAAIKAQVDNAQNQAQLRQVSKADIDKLQARLTKAKADSATISKILDGFGQQRDKVNTDLSKIISLLPGTAKLTSLSYTTGWTIIGITRDADTVLRFSSALKNSGRFSEVLVTNVQQNTSSEWGFTLTIQ